MKMLGVRNPRSGEIDYQVEAWQADDVAAAAGRLRKAQADWRLKGVGYRCEQLKAWRHALQANAGAIAEALCIDTGRRSFAHFEVKAVIGFIDHWVTRAESLMAVQDTQPSAMMPSVH